MDIVSIPIKSSPNLDDPRPWFDIEDTPDGIRIARANCRGADLPAVSSRELPVKAQIMARAATLFPGDAETPAEDLICIAVTLDGNLVVEVPGESDPVYLAHLGFYRKSTDTLELLRFEE